MAERIARGDPEGAAEQLVETLPLGLGAWSWLTRATRQTLIENAPTFLDEARDPEPLEFDLGAIRDFSRPALLTRGD
jgi:hypothetical protein